MLRRVIALLDFIGYSLVIGFCLAFLFLLYYLVKATTDDSEKYRFLRDFVEILFMNQRPQDNPDPDTDKSAFHMDKEPFEDECPACSGVVTHKDRYCPSCGLKVMD